MGVKSAVLFRAPRDEAFDGLTDSLMLIRNGRSVTGDLVVTVLGHTRRETGKAVTYLRLAGVTPPEIHYQRGRTWRN